VNSSDLSKKKSPPMKEEDEALMSDMLKKIHSKRE